MPDKTAVICGELSWNYREFDEACEQLSRGIASLDVKPGDRVALLARNSHALRGAALRAARAWARCWCRSTSCSRPRRSAYILRHAGAQTLRHRQRPGGAGARRRGARHPGASTCVWLPAEDPTEPVAGMLSFDDALPPAPAPPPEVDAGRAATWRRSSTPAAPSRMPKGAMLTHDAVLWQYVSCVVDARHRRRRPRAARAAAVPLRAARRVLRPGDLRRRQQRHHRQAGAGQPAAADRAAPHHLASSRRPRCGSRCCARRCSTRPTCRACSKGYYGASIMPVAVLTEMPATGCRRCGCGTCMARPRSRRWRPCSAPEDQLRKPGSCGQARCSTSRRAWSTTHATTSRPARSARSCTARPQLMIGYFHDDERTARGVRGRLVPQRRPRRRIDDEGYHHRGRPQEGHDQDRRRKRRQPRGRRSDLSARRRVSEVAVIGLADPRWIEAVTAIIVPRRPAHAHRRRSDRALQAHSSAALQVRPSAWSSPKRCRATQAARS
ncbi:MAG: AMP-binding protein [Rhodopseudomonas palustris]|nr:AMP-binding protein [Rhodopseudomonas palustris]